MALRFSKGNAKLAKDTLIFNLPAGKTCPGALHCKAFATEQADGKRKIVDGPETKFRCFAASCEVQYDAVFRMRAENLSECIESLKDEIITQTDNILAGKLRDAILTQKTKNTTKVRIHESGDFWAKEYLQAWIECAKLLPDLKFYCYSKSLHLFLNDDLDADIIDLPDNFYLTASYGGKWDHLIDRGYFPRYAKVFKFEEEAIAEGLEVDHDDSHCLQDGPFALLVHGTQPKGSVWGAAIRDRRKAKQFAGYSH